MLLGACAAVAHGQIALRSQDIHPSIASGAPLAASDVDADGDVDLVSTINGAIVWFSSSGGPSPTFTEMTVWSDFGSWPLLTLADLDGDSDLDVITGSLLGLAWFRNSGGPSPTFTRTSVNGSTVVGLDAADVDLDGDMDIVSVSNGTLWLDRSNGANPPVFTRTAIASASGAIAAGDVNGDGFHDVVVEAGALPNRSIVLVRSNGLPASLSFTPQTLTSGLRDVTSVHIADMDEDGDSDIVSHIETSVSSYRIVRLTNGGGAAPPFVSEAIAIDPAPRVSQMSVADVDADGDADVVYTSRTGDEIHWLESSGGALPVWTQGLLDDRIVNPERILAEDLNGDGTADLAVTTSGTSTGTLLWHRQLRVRNLSALSSHTQIASAAENALVGDALLAEPEHFLESNAPSIDLDGKGLDLDSTAEIVRSGSTHTSLPSGANLRASAGEPVIIEGSLVIPTGAASLIDGGAVTLAGPVAMGSPSSLAVLPLLSMKGAAVFAERLVPSTAPGPATAADLDGDGDVDIASAFEVLTWHENDGGSPVGFTERTTSIALSRAAAPVVADLNGDAHPDIIGRADETTNELVWLEHDGASPPGFVSRSIATPTEFYEFIAAADLDGDGDTDVAAASRFSGRIEWFENVPGSPTTFVARIAATDALAVRSMVCADVDADGDIDLVCASVDLGVVYYANSGGPAPSFTKRVLISPDNVARIACTTDLDGDGDTDIVTAEFDSGALNWLDNDGAPVPGFTTRLIASSAPNAQRILAQDFDGDGDIDLFTAATVPEVSFGGGAAGPDEPVLWFESNGASPPAFTRRPLPTRFFDAGPPLNAEIADVDGDGNPDIVTAPGPVVWYENLRADSAAIPPGSELTASAGVTLANRVLTLDADAQLLSGSMVGVDRSSTLAGLGSVQAPLVASAGTLDLAPPSVLVNAQFEEPPILGPGQTDVLPNSGKWITTSPSGPLYADSISGVQGWSITLDGGAAGVHTDAGISRVSPFQGQRSAYINRWGAVFHQTTGAILPSTQYEATIHVGATSPGKGGRLRLIAGALDGFGNPTPGSSIIAERSFATAGWGGPTPDLAIASNGWTPVSMTYASPSTGPAIGMPLVFAFQLDGGSAGPLEFDSAALTATPPARTTSAFTIVGAYIQSYDDGITGSSAGSLVVPLGDGTAPGMLVVTGNASLAGALRATASPGFAPTIGSSFEVLSAATLTPGSRFATALLPNVGDDRFLSVVYDEGGARALASVSLQVNSLSGDIALDPQAGAESGAAGVPKGATLADIDGDGDPDLLIALPDALSPTTAPGSVVILYNADDGNPANGWEGFGDTLQLTAGVGINPSSVAVGRIDADGQPDIAVANRGTPGNPANDSVSILLIDDPAAATFSTSSTTSFTVGDEPADIIIADLDGDGVLDLATADAGSDSVTIAWNAGAGTGPGWIPVTTQPVELPEEDDAPLSLRPGDTNADLFSFIATANAGTNTIGLIQVNPDRSATVLPSVPAGAAPVEVIVADFNLDGEDDIATVNRNSSSITIVLGATGPAPSLATGLPTELPVPTTSSAPRSIAAGDFDNDANGDIDLAILADGLIKVLRNDLFNGQLAFTPIPDQPGGAAPLLVRSGDLNADGRDDVVTIAESTGVLAIAMHTDGRAGRMLSPVNILLAEAPAPACAGDVNADGDTNAADFVVLAGNFGASVTPNTSGDLNGDGLVNASDFVILAGDFGCGN